MIVDRHLRLARAYGERFPEEIAAFAEHSRRPLEELRRLYPLLQTAEQSCRARLLLDAHVSCTNVGRRLEQNGHDIRAPDQKPALEGLDDDEVLALATAEQRILVTHNVAEFPRILREWAAAQRTPASSSSTASTTGLAIAQEPVGARRRARPCGRG